MFFLVTFSRRYLHPAKVSNPTIIEATDKDNALVEAYKAFGGTFTRVEPITVGEN